MSKPKCYLICGFLGAGKTTFSRQLALERGAVWLNPDEWCVSLFPAQDYEINWDACFARTVELLWEKTRQYAIAKQSVVFDMGFWTKESRRQAVALAKEYGFEPVLYYITASDEKLKERIAHRTGKIATENLVRFDELKRQFEAPESSENPIRIDT